MSSFMGLVLVLVFFNAVSGLSIGNRRYENILKLGAIFNGKDSLTFTEYNKNLETAAGYKLYPDDINGAKIEFEKVDKNGDGLLKFQEMLDSKSDDSGKLLYFELADKDNDGLLDLTEIKSFTLGLFGNSLSDLEVSRITEESLEYLLRHGVGVDFLGQDNQMDFKEYLRWNNAAQTLI